MARDYLPSTVIPAWPPTTWFEQVFYRVGMAAGGYGRGAGIPLSERVRADSAPDPREARLARGLDQPARHCWILVPVDGSGPRPGLLLEWRRSGTGWEGRVVYAAQLRPGRWAWVEEWIAAGLVRTAEKTPPR